VKLGLDWAGLTGLVDILVFSFFRFFFSLFWLERIPFVSVFFLSLQY
jgi:hypothetical protein